MAQRYIGKYVGDTPAKRKFQRKTKDDKLLVQTLHMLL